MGSSSGPADFKPEKLKQLQYRSYRYTMRLLHYSAHHLHFSAFVQQLSHAGHGFNEHRKASALNPVATTDGDELPDGCWEVMHMPNAFSGTKSDGRAYKGDALGFLGPGGMEWLLFDKDIKELVDNWMVDAQGQIYVATKGVPIGGTRLFDHVGMIEKGGNRRRGVPSGNITHRDWFENLASSVPSSMTRPATFKSMGHMKDLKCFLDVVYNKYKSFKEAGYDVSKHGYKPKLAKLVGKPDLAEACGK